MDFRDAARLITWEPWSKGPCVDKQGCGSSDAASVYSDPEVLSGELRYKCFSCGLHVRQSVLTELQNKTMAATTPVQKQPTELTPMQPVASEFRAVTLETFRKYSVQQTAHGELGFPYMKKGETKAYKLKSPDKKFRSEGPIGSCDPLFGMHLFPPDPQRSITITEGELDALSAYQMLGGAGPVVSLKNGAAAVGTDIKAAYEYLTGFEKVILCFDLDKAGKEATKAAAEILGNKAYVFPWDNKTYKDANDWLQAKNAKEFVSNWWKSSLHKPDGIVTMGSLRDRIGKSIAPDAHFSFKGLNRTLGGIFKKRLYMILAGSGSGKSTLLRQFAYDIWASQPGTKLGMLFLEESAEQTATHLVSQYAGKAAHIPEVEWQDGELLKNFDAVVADDRFFFWDNRMESLSPESVMRQMKFMVRVLGVEYIFFDHISMVMGASSEGDERREIDRFMTELRSFVESTGVTVFAINHLSKSGSGGKSAEEGGRVRLSDARGSGAIYQLSDVVIGCERDQQNENPEKALEVTYRVLKNRPTSTQGVAAVATYDRMKDKLIEKQYRPLEAL